MKPFVYHFKGIVKTLELLFKGKFLLFFIPGIVITVIYYWFTSYTKSIEEAVQLSSSYGWLDWLTSGVNYATSAAFSFFDFLTAQLYIFVVLTILSPFNTALSEKLDEELTGFKVKFDLLTFLNDFIRMVFVVCIIFALECTILVGYWMLSWLFGLDIIDPVMYFLIAAFFFGFSFYDFSLERYKENVWSSLGFSFSHILSMLLTGSIFLGIYNIPYIGIPISPVIAVMVSTIVYLYISGRITNTNTDLTQQ